MPNTNAASLDRLRQTTLKLFTVYKINFGLRLAGQCSLSSRVLSSQDFKASK